MIKNDKLAGILAIVTYILMYIFTAFIPLIIPLDKFSTSTRYLISSVYEIIILIIIFLIHSKTVKKDFNNYFSNIKYYITNYIKYWLLALASMYVCNLILFIISGGIAANEQSVRELFTYYPVITFILAAFIAPMLEESIFRISLYKIIGQHKWLFIILSGLIFGSMHIFGNVNNIIDFLYIIPYSIPGCFFAYALHKSDNMFVPISLHMIHNTFALILLIITSIIK